nr:uncharacterized protein LOC111770809 [Equus caballus]
MKAGSRGSTKARGMQGAPVGTGEPLSSPGDPSSAAGPSGTRDGVRSPSPSAQGSSPSLSRDLRVQARACGWSLSSTAWGSRLETPPGREAEPGSVQPWARSSNPSEPPFPPRYNGDAAAALQGSYGMGEAAWGAAGASVGRENTRCHHISDEVVPGFPAGTSARASRFSAAGVVSSDEDAEKPDDHGLRSPLPPLVKPSHRFRPGRCSSRARLDATRWSRVGVRPRSPAVLVWGPSLRQPPPMPWPSFWRPPSALSYFGARLQAVADRADDRLSGLLSREDPRGGGASGFWPRWAEL